MDDNHKRLILAYREIKAMRAMGITDPVCNRLFRVVSVLSDVVRDLVDDSYTIEGDEE